MTTPILSNRIFAKISELDPAVDFANADEFVFVQNGSTLKISGQQIANSVTIINNLASIGYVNTLDSQTKADIAQIKADIAQIKADIAQIIDTISGTEF